MRGLNCTALWIKALYKCSPFTIYTMPQGSSLSLSSAGTATAVGILEGNVRSGREKGGLAKEARGFSETQHYITCHLADTFIQSDLQLIRLSRRHSPLEHCGVKGLAQGLNGCADLIVATPRIEPPTLRVEVK